MGKSFLQDTEEQRGQVPNCTGALLEIVEIERGKTGERSKNPGMRKYTPIFKIVEPKQLAGMQVRDHRIVVGTPEDPLAKKPETWDRAEGGPGRLKRLLSRSGTPISDDDEEWMEAAEGNQVVAPLVADPGGEFPTSPGLYFRPSDDDAPEIGLAPEEGKGGKGKGGKAKGAAAGAKRARGRTGTSDEPEEAEEDEDEKPAAKPAKGKPAKDTDDDEDDDEEPASKAKPARAKQAAKAADDDEDDDD